MVLDLFGTLKNVSEEQWSTKFRILKDDQYGERDIVLQWTEGLVDRDHNMIEKFQKTFHSSFWEFYLYACFKEAGFDMDQTHNRPDFMITKPFEMNVEAVVANIKQGGRPESDRGASDLMDMFVPPRNQKDFFALQHEAITRQSNALQSKIKKYSEYSKCGWVKKDVPYVIALSSYGQVNYGREYIYPMMTLLYGMYYLPEEDDYRLVEDIPKPDSNARIPVGLFRTNEYSEISAVLYSCTTTLGKVTSLSISKGNQSPNVVFNLRRDYGDPRRPYKIHEVNFNSPEMLTDGLFLFHNPFAKNKLDIKNFENTNITQYFFKANKFVHTANTFPIVCRLNIPKLIRGEYVNLIDEYYRQYNRVPPLEYYSLELQEKVEIDFEKNCLVCIWFSVTPEGLHMRNIHYERPQSLSDNFLKREVYAKMVKIRQRSNKYYIGTVRRIDIIRTEEQYNIVNQV